MTPDLLRIVRSCAKWRGGFLLVATLFAVLAVGALPAPGNGGMARLAPKLPPPVLAPAGVTDLRARALSDSALVLTWTEVSSGSTAIPRYVVRYDSVTIDPFLWSAKADVVTGDCAAPIVSTRAAGGRPRACILSGLVPRHGYDVQMVSYTGTLNTAGVVFGPLSNIAHATTAERVGPMLVMRPRLNTADSVYMRAVWFSAPGYANDTFPMRGWFNVGDYRAAAFVGDSLVLKGYLLVTRP